MPVVGLLLLAIAAQAQVEFFPEGSLDSTPRGHRFKLEWYSKHLVALREKALWTPPRPQVRTVRFLWLRTFDRPICISVVESQNGTGVLTVKETDGQGGYQPGRLIRNRKRVLSKDEMLAFLSGVNRVEFSPKPPLGDIVGLDGAQWIVESLGPGGYRLLDVWSPIDRHPVHALGLLMIRLAGLRIPKRDIY